MKYLLLLLPTISFANYISGNGNVTYWSKAVCEKNEQAKCYKLPEDAETKKLVEVEVDDTSKPIIEDSVPELVRNPENGLDEQRCLAPKELSDGKCIEIKGYEKKREKQFVVDPVKLKEKEDKKKAIDEKVQSCETFKVLLKDSAIDDKSKPADVQEVTRRLLGYWKACQ